MSEWGDRIRARREELGMTGRQLAAACDIRPPSVSDWETGETKMIDGLNLVKASKALQTTPAWIMTGQGGHVESQPAELDAYKLGVAIVSAREAAKATGKILDEVDAAELISFAYREALRYGKKLSKPELKDFDAMLRHQLRGDFANGQSRRSPTYESEESPRATAPGKKKAGARG